MLLLLLPMLTARELALILTMGGQQLLRDALYALVVKAAEVDAPTAHQLRHWQLQVAAPAPGAAAGTSRLRQMEHHAAVLLKVD